MFNISYLQRDKTRNLIRSFVQLSAQSSELDIYFSFDLMILSQILQHIGWLHWRSNQSTHLMKDWETRGKMN